MTARARHVALELDEQRVAGSAHGIDLDAAPDR